MSKLIRLFFLLSWCRDLHPYFMRTNIYSTSGNFDVTLSIVLFQFHQKSWFWSKNGHIYFFIGSIQVVGLHQSLMANHRRHLNLKIPIDSMSTIMLPTRNKVTVRFSWIQAQEIHFFGPKLNNFSSSRLQIRANFVFLTLLCQCITWKNVSGSIVF